MAGNETGNGDGGKSDGDDNKVGGQATASNGEGGRWQAIDGDNGNGDGGGDGDDVGDGDGDEAGGR